MELLIDHWTLLFIFGISIGSLLVSVLLLKKHSIHVNNISIILIILIAILFNEILQGSELFENYPFLNLVTFTADLLTWPFLLFYIQHICGKRNFYGIRDLYYFIPFILGLALQIPYFLKSKAEQLNYYAAGIPNEVALIVAYKFVVSIVFLLFCIRLINRSVQQLFLDFPKNKKVKFFIKFKKAIWSLLMIITFIYCLFFVNYFGYSFLGDSDKIGSLLITIIFYVLAILIYNDAQLFSKDNYSKNIKVFFNNNEADYMKGLLHLFKTQKPYLNEKLSLEDIAVQMSLSNQQLSYLLNRQLGLTFSDFVNSYRVIEFQNRIQQHEYLDHTLLSIAYDSGFNSKASFNRIFKSHTAYTPSQYVKIINNKA